MKNFEHYKDKFMQYEGKNLECVASEKILGRKCYDDCRKCRKFIKEWLYEEYKEPIKQTEDEKIILRNLHKKYKYIARDKNGSLYLYRQKPCRAKENWINTNGIFTNLCVFGHLFQFIKWEDEEPYNIEELLKEK